MKWENFCFLSSCVIYILAMTNLKLLEQMLILRYWVTVSVFRIENFMKTLVLVKQIADFILLSCRGWSPGLIFFSRSPQNGSSWMLHWRCVGLKRRGPGQELGAKGFETILEWKEGGTGSKRAVWLARAGGELQFMQKVEMLVCCTGGEGSVWSVTTTPSVP